MPKIPNWFLYGWDYRKLSYSQHTATERNSCLVSNTVYLLKPNFWALVKTDSELKSKVFKNWLLPNISSYRDITKWPQRHKHHLKCTVENVNLNTISTQSYRQIACLCWAQTTTCIFFSATITFKTSTTLCHYQKNLVQKLTDMDCHFAFICSSMNCKRKLHETSRYVSCTTPRVIHVTKVLSFNSF